MVKRKKPNTHQQSLGDELESPETYGVRVRSLSLMMNGSLFCSAIQLSDDGTQNWSWFADKAPSRQEAERRVGRGACECLLHNITASRNIMGSTKACWEGGSI